MNSLILDITVVVTLAIFLVVGFRNGVMRAFVLFVGTIFSSVFSGYFSGRVSNFVFETFVSPAIESHVLKSISENTFNFNSFCSKLPFLVEDSLSYYGITPSSFDHIISNSTERELPLRLSALIEPIFTNVFKYIFSVLIFVVLMLCVRLCARFVLKMCKHKPINHANSLVGGFFGGLKGYLVISVVLCCVRALLPMVHSVPEILSQDSISSSMVFKELYYENPIYNMFQKM